MDLIAVHPILDPVRDDARLGALLSQMKLPVLTR
jgi:hypothetical protein